MHEISRHTIHISEVLLVTILNFEKLREVQLHVHNEIMQAEALSREYREQAQEYLSFQIQMLKSLRERSISNHARLSSEITVAYNRIAQQDNKVMSSIALLTMTFLPAAFISSFFSTTFFSFDKEGLKVSRKFWMYWAVTIPLTVIIVILWRVLLHRNTPAIYRSVQTWVLSLLKRRRRDENANEKELEGQEKNPV